MPDPITKQKMEKYLKDKRFLQNELVELKRMKLRSWLSAPDKQRYIQIIQLLRKLRREYGQIGWLGVKTSSLLVLTRRLVA